MSLEEIVIFLSAPQNYKREQDPQGSSAAATTDLFPSHNKIQAFTTKTDSNNETKPKRTKQIPPNPQTPTQRNSE